MKHLRIISPIPLLIFVSSLFFPFVEHDHELGSFTTQFGHELPFVYVSLGIMVFILLVANIKRTRFTSIIAFVLCFGLIFSLFLLQFQMHPVSSYDVIHTNLIGYFIALFSAALLIVILLINLVLFFKESIQQENNPS